MRPCCLEIDLSCGVFNTIDQLDPIVDVSQPLHPKAFDSFGSVVVFRIDGRTFGNNECINHLSV